MEWHGTTKKAVRVTLNFANRKLTPSLSSPRKRGPSDAAMGSRFRGNDKWEAGVTRGDARMTGVRSRLRFRLTFGLTIGGIPPYPIAAPVIQMADIAMMASRSDAASM